jgi:putative choline sulfate-utilization transcription factor
MRILAAIGNAGSLTAAAQALGLSQPAVSYQIRRIEEQIGVSLLKRQHRGVVLTPEGRRLFEIVSRSVAEIDQFALQFRNPTQKPVVRLHTDYAFSSLWLMPRMPGFQALYPGINIQLVAAQRTERQGLREDDVVVVFGSRAEAGQDAVLLIPEKVAPVCAGSFAGRQGGFGDVAALARQRLVHLDTPSPAPWFEWKSYFAAFGIARDVHDGHGDVSFNTYSLVVQAAMGEQGLAIGWLGLIDPLLADGMLVTAGPELEAPDRGYWLLDAAGRSALGGRLRAWLMAEAGLS